jgi:hypothetical protein
VASGPPNARGDATCVGLERLAQYLVWGTAALLWVGRGQNVRPCLTPLPQNLLGNPDGAEQLVLTARGRNH